MRRRHGVVIVVVLWVVAILVVVCLALAGSVQFGQAQLRRSQSHARTTQALRAALVVGQSLLAADDASFDGDWETWATPLAEEAYDEHIVFRLLTGDGQPGGLEDESARLNANTATPEMLARLPGMTVAVAEALVARRESVREQTGLRRPLAGTTGTFASPAQLAAALSEAMGQGGLLHGPGGEVNGAAQTWEDHWPAPVAQVMQHLTVHTRQRNMDAVGRGRLNLNTASRQEMLLALDDALSGEQVEAIIRSRDREPFVSIGELFTRRMTLVNAEGAERVVTVSRGEFRRVADRLTTTDARMLYGLVNVNTASREVLVALGLTEAQADAIMSARTQVDSPWTLAWLLDVLDEPTFAALCPHVTTRSQQFRLRAEVEAATGASGAVRGRSRALAILERDGPHTSVLFWLTWQVRAR